MLWGIAVRGYWKEQAREARERTYQSTLGVYSNDLKPGLTRKNVEAYLRERRLDFERMCCVGRSSYYADLVKIGEEAASWYCSDEYVYMAFEFAAVKPHTILSGSYLGLDSDVLRHIEIYRFSADCL